jgi:hypothetical protein
MARPEPGEEAGKHVRIIGKKTTTAQEMLFASRMWTPSLARSSVPRRAWPGHFSFSICAGEPGTGPSRRFWWLASLNFKMFLVMLRFWSHKLSDA